ncbi:MAG: isochorismatase family cysteine hydrolase [Pyrinomonadaceae bacterium]
MRKRPSLKPKRINAVSTALLIVDLISDFEFEDGDALLKNALPAARTIAALKARAKKKGVPAIYVNDNFGKWQEDFKTMADHFMKIDAKGREVVETLRPASDDYYILKPHRSAFYSTTLELLLRELNVKSLILTGVTADNCILFTANDAYMRDFDLYIPADCVSAVTLDYKKQAIKFISRVLKAETTASNHLTFFAKK